MKSYSVRMMLMLLLTVVLIPTMLIQAYIYHDRFHTRRAKEFESNLEVARATSRAFNAFVRGILQQQIAIAVAATTEPFMGMANLQHLLTQSAKAAPPVRHVLWIDPVGRVLASSFSEGVGLDISDRKYFQQIATGREWVVGDLILSKISGEPVFTINRGVRDARGQLVGVVVTAILADELGDILPVQRTGEACIHLIDGNGRHVYRYPEAHLAWKQRDWPKRFPVFAALLIKGGETTAILPSPITGEDQLTAFSPIPGIGWFVAASRSEKDAMGPVRAALRAHFLLFLMVALCTFVVAVVLARLIVMSIARLRAHALALGRGEISRMAVTGGPSEFKDLATVFNHMAETVRRRESALQEKENRYRELVQYASSAIIRWKTDGTITFFNEFAESFFGYSHEEVLGKPINIIIPQVESDGADLSGMVVKLIAHPERYENQVNENICRDGRRVWMNWANRPIFDAHGQMTEVLSIGSDVTERKRAEDELRKSEEIFRSVVDNLTEGLFIHSPSGRIVYRNPASLRMHGFDENQDPRSDQEASETWEVTTMQGEPVPFERWMHNQVLRGQRFKDVLAHVRRSDGKCAFYGSYSGVPLYDSNGNVRLALITVRDETARIRAERELREINRRLEQMVQERTAMLAKMVQELESANQQLDHRARQLAALTGELTMTEQRERKRLSKILHDGLQQQLAATKMQVEGLVAQVDRNAGFQQTISEIEQMLAESIRMSRSLSADLSPPALHEGGLADGLEWLVRRTWERHAFKVDLVIEQKPDLSEDVKILVFESVRELLFNAVKYAKVSAAKIILRQAEPTGLQICVSDEGVGFDPALLIPSGETGGGFGLFSVRERLALIGGTLTIDSTLGKGSCFLLTVPYEAKREEGHVSVSTLVASDSTAAEPVGAFIRVLVADDHTLFRDGIARLLAKEVDIAVVGQARNGKEVIDLSQQLNPHVILMDISMPGINGIEATRVIHAQSPGIRIVGLSMYEDEERAEVMRQAGAVGYKSKTCPVSELVAAVRDAVRASG
ncbi:MAG: hypothetical protein VR64_04635 [Desulfatitalea sp. BRH_c12]|nr:MAG: hypothetical protein VR64_04635 [Desulfatitalea sp. BRH_c12]